MIIPRIRYCNQGDGDERIIKSKLNPSGQSGNSTAEVVEADAERCVHNGRQEPAGFYGPPGQSRDGGGLSYSFEITQNSLKNC
jgi:hypothetical protein